jgi:uncharacterized protein YjbI with pentapeptide repeats
MSDELSTSDATPAQCGDVATWLHNGERVDAFTLGTLVQRNRGTEGLDLHGANLMDVDLTPGMITKLAAETQLEYFVFWSFRKHAGFRRAHLEYASLWGAKLQHADFYEAHLEKANLSGAHVEGASFERAHLHGADLSSAYLEGANLQHSKMQGTNLYMAQLANADLKWADLQQAEPMWAGLEGADLYGARLERVNLTGAQLRGARFTNATLCGARLCQAQLQDVDFYFANSLDGVHWYGAFLDRTRMTRHQLGEAIGDEQKAKILNTGDAYQEAMEAYLILKNNFNSIGRYEDASWAYVKEQQMEKMAHYRSWRSSLRKNWFSFLRWLRNWAYELLTGYGERVWMPVIWTVVVIAAFTVGYAVAGNISPDFAGDPAAAHGSHNVVDALTHSIGAFATIGFNTLEPLGWGARLLTAIESAFGIGLFALFIFTLGNRMSRS